MIQAGDTIGPYTLIRALGRGAFGEVWLAEKHSALVTIPVALKLPLVEKDAIETVRKEAALWLKASGHPNVVPFLDADIYDDQVVIASEYIAGGSLYDSMQARAGARPVEEVVRLTDGILAGLDYLHRSGLTHRDLKPDNVLLQDGIPRLTDFGLARVLGSAGQTGTITGTPRYMAPETFSGDYSAASDLWAVGAIMHELISGIHPFPAADLMALILDIQNSEPTTLPDAIPQRVRAFVSQLLSKSPADRFPSAASAREAIQTALTPPAADLQPTVTLLNYLPAQTSSFIGRKQETAEAENLLRTAGVRLVTLTGFGGMGKSRLAIQIAERCASVFPDGVWWLEMDEIMTGSDLIARIAEKLRLPVQSGNSVKEQCRLALRDKNLLLVLDNLEQIPDAADVLRDLLANTTDVKCLVTSRRVLELRGERVLELDPLSLPDAEKLFASRAQESSADFALADANRRDVAELCRKLEGIPLALELAAARIRSLTPRQMQERLNERFRLLQSRSPDLPPRQRALSGAIEWSYLLMEEEERKALAQMSVFAGGFVLEDAEAVCDVFDVFESVEILRRHSFFRVETDAKRQQTRFLTLESVREYAAERLRDISEGDKFHLRHAERFLARAQAHLAQLRTVGEPEALAALERDSTNFYAAESWARETGAAPLSAELELVLGRWRHRRGFGQQAVNFIQYGLDALASNTETYPTLNAALLRERAGLHLDVAELASARARAEEARDISIAQKDAFGQAQADNLLGQAAMTNGDFTEARSRFGSALDIFTRAGTQVEIAIVRNNLGLTERRDTSETNANERLQRSEAHLQEALRLRRALRDGRGLAETLNNLGVLAFDRGDFTSAEDYYIQALEHERELQSVYDIALLLANLGEVAKLNNPLRASWLFAASELFLEEIGSSIFSTIVSMKDSAAVEACLSQQAQQALRAALQSLPPEQRIDLALRGSPPS